MAKTRKSSFFSKLFKGFSLKNKSRRHRKGKTQRRRSSSRHMRGG